MILQALLRASQLPVYMIGLFAPRAYSRSRASPSKDLLGVFLPSVFLQRHLNVLISKLILLDIIKLIL